ncbi:hypothetical protein HK104_002752 [Borealophlyctis nickersoniae]|nr:hypothetical protein HK104_002752 [Borealophlyctis nickersoniae]
MEIPPSSSPPLLRAVLRHAGAPHVVLLTDSTLALSPAAFSSPDQPAYSLDNVYAITTSDTPEVLVHILTETEGKKKATLLQFAALSDADALPPQFADDGTLTFAVRDAAALKKFETTMRKAVADLNPRTSSVTWKVHVFVNPFSGKADGLRIWENVAKPMFAAAGWKPPEHGGGHTLNFGEESGAMIFSVTITTRPGHAEETARKLVLDGALSSEEDEEVILVAIGGDGLVHELVNGILKSPSFRPHRKLCLGIIPAGTGNALATTLNITSAEDGAFRIIKGSTRVPLNVSSVHVGKVGPDGPQWGNDSFPPVLMYSAIVVSWGLHAQIVKQSEILRLLGNRRFKLAALANIIFFHHYKGRLYLHNASQHEAPLSKENEEATATSFAPSSLAGQGPVVPFSSGREATGFSYFLATKMSSLEPGFRIAPYASPSSPDLDLILCPDVSRGDTVRMLGAATTGGGHPSLPFVKYVKARGFVFVPDTASAAARAEDGGILSLVAAKIGLGGRRAHDVCVDGEMLEVEDGNGVWVRVLEEGEQVFDVIS